MITYIEKGMGLHKAIIDAGHWLEERGGTWVASDETAVQTIIDAYEELPDYKNIKKDEIKAEGLSRINAIYPAISSIDDLQLVRDQYLSVLQAARSPTADFTSMIDIYTAAKVAIDDINSATDKAGVDAVSATWP